MSGAGSGSVDYPDAPALGVVPARPIDMDGVVAAFPTIRQSLASLFDECELSALYKMRYENGWTTSPAARGTLFHRFAGECLRTMREQDSMEIPEELAEAILEEVIYQRGIPHSERVRVPIREMPFLEMTARKFARDNSFSIRRILDVERRLEAVLDVPHWETGEVYQRRLTGQIDALIAASVEGGRDPDEAIILDWKNTWRQPQQPRDANSEAAVTEPGYFQLIWYGWLVFKSYPAVQVVSLREFYVARTRARMIRLERSSMEEIERRLRRVISAFDRAVASGSPRRLTIEALKEHGSWMPQPGQHCFYCPARYRCPIPEEARLDLGIRDQADAQRFANIRTWAKALVKGIDAALKPWADIHGPVPINTQKGRRVLGHRSVGGGSSTRWDEYDPAEDEALPPRNPDLESAMTRSVQEARAMHKEHS